jgi:hypothetical protein
VKKIELELPRFEKTDAALAGVADVIALSVALRAVKGGMPGASHRSRALVAAGFGLATGWILLRERGLLGKREGSQ